MDSINFNLEEITTEDIKLTLEKYLIPFTSDEDGDIFIEKPSRVYIEVNNEKEVVRFFSFIFIKDHPNKENIPNFVNKLNKSSYSLSYTMMRESILCEYRLFMAGSSDEKLIIKTIKRVESEVAEIKEVLPYIKDIEE